MPAEGVLPYDLVDMAANRWRKLWQANLGGRSRLQPLILPDEMVDVMEVEESKAQATNREDVALLTLLNLLEGELHAKNSEWEAGQGDRLLGCMAYARQVCQNQSEKRLRRLEDTQEMLVKSVHVLAKDVVTKAWQPQAIPRAVVASVKASFTKVVAQIESLLEVLPLEHFAIVPQIVDRMLGDALVLDLDRQRQYPILKAVMGYLFRELFSAEVDNGEYQGNNRQLTTVIVLKPTAHFDGLASYVYKMSSLAGRDEPSRKELGEIGRREMLNLYAGVCAIAGQLFDREALLKMPHYLTQQDIGDLDKGRRLDTFEVGEVPANPFEVPGAVVSHHCPPLWYDMLNKQFFPWLFEMIQEAPPYKPATSAKQLKPPTPRTIAHHNPFTDIKRTTWTKLEAPIVESAQGEYCFPFLGYLTDGGSENAQAGVTVRGNTWANASGFRSSTNSTGSTMSGISTDSAGFTSTWGSSVSLTAPESEVAGLEVAKVEPEPPKLMEQPMDLAYLASGRRVDFQELTNNLECWDNLLYRVPVSQHISERPQATPQMIRKLSTSSSRRTTPQLTRKFSTSSRTQDDFENGFETRTTRKVTIRRTSTTNGGITASETTSTTTTSTEHHDDPLVPWQSCLGRIEYPFIPSITHP
ncbi:hypothetical protein GNI_141760 [Gregarina niphandrodes]|uniref:Uncharacterized protein n=1 Tax=Gregarina niphandrodes TaxID=110365 RepID=A0A023B048_GRENI|nr:hypothetical protein GNI_141760 [Gregarina niphandrodes]EZG45001.1 hypothetical protein GNI_141760 [Gregarina niphandrodes]|eukprot:XP_011132600.1 hypothetical protein GNI_141760 [Gregarina niphandrodes]